MLNIDYIRINSNHASYVRLIIVLRARNAFVYSVRCMLSFDYNNCNMIYKHVAIIHLVYMYVH